MSNSRRFLRSISFLLTGAIPFLLGGFSRQAFAQPDSLASLQRAFERPPDDSRIMMRWWWFGPSVTKAGLEREMRLMKEGGNGGFEVQPVYPLALDDPEHASGIFPIFRTSLLTRCALLPRKRASSACEWI